MKKKIGFVGCYSHDVILMFIRALGCMGKRVLLRDCNKQHTLHASIPMPEGICVANTVLEYDGFLFTAQDTDSTMTEDYTIEAVDFGMEGEREKFEECTEIIVITDMLLHHIRKLKDIPFSKEKVRICILRDSLEDICKREQEVNSFLQQFPNKTVFFLPPDLRDVKNRYVCETLHEYSITKASSEMQEVICRMVGMFYPEYQEREIRRSIKSRERRRYR